MKIIISLFLAVFSVALIHHSYAAAILDLETSAQAITERLPNLTADAPMEKHHLYGKNGAEFCAFFGRVDYIGNGKDKKVSSVHLSLNSVKDGHLDFVFFDMNDPSTSVFVFNVAARVVPAEPEKEGSPTLDIETVQHYPDGSLETSHFKIFGKKSVEAIEISRSGRPGEPAKTQKCSGLQITRPIVSE